MISLQDIALCGFGINNAGTIITAMKNYKKETAINNKYLIESTYASAMEDDNDKEFSITGIYKYYEDSDIRVMYVYHESQKTNMTYQFIDSYYDDGQLTVMLCTTYDLSDEDSSINFTFQENIYRILCSLYYPNNKYKLLKNDNDSYLYLSKALLFFARYIFDRTSTIEFLKKKGYKNFLKAIDMIEEMNGYQVEYKLKTFIPILKTDRHLLDR